jgi:iron complex outermembrane receptor protein
VQTASFTPCSNIAAFACAPASAAQGIGGTGSYSLQQTKYRDYALYAQGSYKITPELNFTAGFRYTWDKMNTRLNNLTSVFNVVPDAVKFGCSNLTAPGFLGVINGFGPNPALSPLTASQRIGACTQFLTNSSSAPTWLIQADWKPTDGVMVYGKWSRGYRQGGLAIFGPDPIQSYKPEKVDTYEIGTKTSWRGAVPGSFNMSAYYNDFRNQQLQLGTACVASLPNFTGGCAGNATIINSGKSTIWGLEADLNVSPFDGMKLSLSYGYINAKINQVTIPTVLPPYNSITGPLAEGCGGPQCNTIANSGPPHQLVASAFYTLPLDESAGKFTLGGTVVYQSARRIVSDGVVNRTNPAVPVTSGAGIAPASTVLNLNATWENVAQMPIDLSFFMTNVTNERVILQINDNTLRGFISSNIGEPRMWGFRLKYHFGD